jgi:very-short-patch-repair endonuclease
MIEPSGCDVERERLIVELDGRASHGASQAFERDDRERDRLLLLDGWRVVRVTWLQLRDTPEAVAADIRALLADPPTSTLRA